MMTYPTYWLQEKEFAWLKTGGLLINATLVVQDSIVEYELYDGNQRYIRKREFLNPDKAKGFAIRFGRLMKRVEKSGAVPSLWNFSAFR